MLRAWVAKEVRAARERRATKLRQARARMGAIRGAEIDAVARWFAPGRRVLELGGGNGYQASRISEWGCLVDSIDVKPPAPSQTSYYPVRIYDGHHIPFADGTFDVVFSSTVLEEIEHLDAMLEETRRVLNKNGLAVHVVPTTAWRFWNTAGYLLKAVRSGLSDLLKTALSVVGATEEAPRRERSTIAEHIRASLRAYGPYPSAVSELYYYSRWRWRRLFRRHGWRIVHVSGNGIFYTGHGLLPRLPLGARKLLSQLLGSPCDVFVIAPNHRSDLPPGVTRRPGPCRAGC